MCIRDSTWFTVPASEVGRFTTNYGIMNGTPIPMDPAKASIYLDKPPFPFGGAGLVSSPRDYDRFLKMLLGYGVIDGKRVMGELAVRVGTSNLLPETATTEGTWVEGQGFGAGGRVTDGSYGWGGAAGTVAFVYYKAGLRANLMTQYMPSDSYPIHEGLSPYSDEIGRDVTEEDIETLLKIPIRRISLYDIQRAQKEMREIRKRLREINKHLKQIIPYAIEFLEGILERYGAQFVRRTEIESFDKIDVRQAARRDLKLRYDSKNGYLGYTVNGESLFETSQYDRILVIRKDGTYSVICLLYTSPSPRDQRGSRMPSSA